MPLLEALLTLQSVLRDRGADADNPLPVQELRKLLIAQDRRFDKSANPRAATPRLISTLLKNASDHGLVSLAGQYPDLRVALLVTDKPEGTPFADLPGQLAAQEVEPVEVTAPSTVKYPEGRGNGIAPDWVSLEPSAPGDRLLSATANWPTPRPPAGSTTPSLDIVKAWRHFEEGDYAAARQTLEAIRLAIADDEWLPRSTADGLRFWHWMRLVHELAGLSSGRVLDRRRSALSAFELSLRCLPAADVLCQELKDRTLADFGAHDPLANRAWAVYAARAAKAAGHEYAFEAYENDEKANLRRAWATQFPRDVSARNSTHEMAETVAHKLAGLERELAHLYRAPIRTRGWVDTVRAVKQLFQFLDTGEETLAQEAVEVISESGRALDEAATNSPRDLHELVTSLDSLGTAIAGSSSLLLQDLVSPNLYRLRLELLNAIQQLGDALHPQLTVLLENPRLPFSAKCGVAYLIRLRISNVGNATAEGVRLTLRAEDVQIDADVAAIDLRPGAESIVEIPAVACEAKVNAVAIRCVAAWTNSLDQPFQWSGSLLAENERSAGWLITDTNPFSLGTISDPSRLVGREEDLATLDALIAGGGSAYVTGQKRVGKTSLVRVLIERLRETRTWPGSILPLGRALGSHQTAGDLVLALLDEVRQAIVEDIPSLSDRIDDPTKGSTENFARDGNRWLRTVARLLPRGTHIVIAIDDFDELPSQLISGPEADSFFLFLRSLVDEPWLNLMVVGSEVLPTIVQGQEHKLNQVVPYSVTNFQARESTEALLVTPTRDRLEWSVEAIDAAHSLCSGNPYYETLLGAQVWQALRESSRGYVTGGDIDSAAVRICSTAPASHFVHLWADDVSGMDRSSRNAVIGSAVLRAVARCGGLGLAPATTHEVLAVAQGWVPAVPSVDIEKSVQSLLARGVLSQSASRDAYQLSVPLAARWLQGNGATVLDQSYAASAYAKSRANVVTDADLTTLSRGLLYGGEHISEIRIRAWLEQFGSGDQQYFAYLMLRRMVEDGYFTTTRLNETLIPRLREQVLLCGAARSIVRDNNRYMKNGYLLRHGRPGDSTQGATSAISKALQIKKANVLEPDALVAEVLSRPAASVVFVLDDFVGSGRHLESTFHKFVESLESQREDWAESIDIVVGGAVVADRMALPGTARPIRGVHPVSGTLLGERFRPFSDSAGVFANSKDREAATDLMAAIGRSLLPSNPLGFGGDALLALLEFNCPNTAAPIFWKDGEYGGNPWRALFPRRF